MLYERTSSQRSLMKDRPANIQKILIQYKVQFDYLHDILQRPQIYREYTQELRGRLLFFQPPLSEESSGRSVFSISHMVHLISDD